MKKNIINFLAVTLFSFCVAYATSNETGNAFNEYMSPESGINPMSGTVAFSKKLTEISSGTLKSTLTLNYSGNVFQNVQNRNDKYPSSWLGLGWSMGFAQIVSENNGSMSLEDDTYYLRTAEGLTGKIVNDPTKSKKWWIESMPFWNVEPIVVKDQTFGSKKYDIIVGWTLTDPNGNKYTYGEGVFCGNTSNGKPCSEQGATQYELSWPETYGHTGSAIGGRDYPYPTVWNLSKQVDLNGNTLTYYYEQVMEGLKISTSKLNFAFGSFLFPNSTVSSVANAYSPGTYNWQSINKYTKECYLKKIVSSTGTKIELSLKEKGEKEFEGELIDLNGKNETLKNGIEDAVVDPLERKYLSEIKVIGKDNKAIGYIEFCYKPLKLVPTANEAENKKYVKRLLTRIVWFNGNHKETERESYVYNEDVGAVGEKAVGALVEIQGSNCGLISFKYEKKNLTATEDKLHKDVVDVTKIAIGTLDDGTRYLVGMSNKDNAVYVYAWQNGTWGRKTKIEGLSYHGDGSFIAMQNWFAYKTGDDSYSVYPVVWNGSKWVVGNAVTDNDTETYIAIGPNYIAKAKITGSWNPTSKDHLDLYVPWTMWGKTYSYTNISAESGSMDGAQMSIEAARNHMILRYLGPKLIGDDLRVKIISFDYSKSNSKTETTLDETMFERGLEDADEFHFVGDKVYSTNRSTIFNYGSVYAKAYHWDGSSWLTLLNKKLDGVQQTLSGMEAYGADYLATRHDDEDDLTLFSWNGEKWSTPYDNVNMVHHDNLDLFEPARWHGVSSNDYFIAKRPWINNKIKVPYFCWPSVRMWGVKWKCNYVEVWSNTHNSAKIELFQNIDGKWKRYGEKQTCENGSKSEKESEKDVIAASDWFVEKKSKKAFIWNGNEWVEEQLNISNIDKASVLNDFLVIENGENTEIYFKKNDSFIKNPYSFVVSEKTVDDPVEDKRVVYSYGYYAENMSRFYDYMNNTPLFNVHMVTLPGINGTIKSNICGVDNQKGKLSFDNLGLALGQKCVEKKTVNGVVEEITTYNYDRLRDDNNWPSSIYTDVVSSIEKITKGKKSTMIYEYNKSNGAVASLKTLIGKTNKPYVEKKYKYAHEINAYSYLKDSNRLLDSLIEYSCMPDCENGNVVDAKLKRFSHNIVGSSLLIPADEWLYTPSKQKKKGKNLASELAGYQWTNLSLPVASDWTKQSSVNRYVRGMVSEKDDLLGNKSAVIYDNTNPYNQRAVVKNAGVNEVLVVPGDACQYADVNINSCTLTNPPLDGNAVDGIGKDGSRYGRFAATAIDLGKGAFAGAISNPKGGVYRFSAWVQKIDDGNANVSLNVAGNVKNTWNLANTTKGDWTYIEWEGDVPSYYTQLTVSAQGNVRMQDLRYIPSSASVETYFYDGHFNLPLVKVDRNSVGEYTALDENGRVYRKYTENVNGQLVLVSENEYTNSVCRAVSNTRGELESVLLNGELLDVPEAGDFVEVAVDNFVDDAVFSWKTAQKGDKVDYRFYAENSSTPDWAGSCCAEIEGFSESLNGSDAWVLELKVDSKIYKFKIKKSNVGWVKYGSTLDFGENPIYTHHSDSSHILYRSENGLVLKEFSQNSWSTSATQNGDFVNLQSAGYPYVFAMPNIALEGPNNTESPYSYKALSGGSFSNQGQITNSNVGAGLYRVALNSSGTPYAVYKEKLNNPISFNLKSVIYSNGTWKSVGSLAVFEHADEAPVLKNGLVASGEVTDADLILGPNNDLYVAYIGSYPYKDTPEYIAQANDPNSSVDDIKAMPKLVFIKKLYKASDAALSGNESVWAGPSLTKDSKTGTWLPNYYGDFLAVNDTTPVTSVSRVKLGFYKDTLYVAVAYQVSINEDESKMAISVFKGAISDVQSTSDGVTTEEKRLVFTVIEDEMIKQNASSNGNLEESKIVAYLEPESSFDFWVKNGVPYIMFENSQNEDALTVVQYNGTRWLSVGNPAFAAAKKTTKSANMAIGTGGTPTVVFENENDSKIKPLKHVEKYASEIEKNLTISTLGVTGGNTTLSSDFRQYIKNYVVHVASNESAIWLDPKPLVANDIVSLKILVGDSVVGTRKYKTSNTFARLWGKLRALYNSNNEKIKVPLKEGLNVVKIAVKGIDAKTFNYTIMVNRQWKNNDDDGLSIITSTVITSSDLTNRKNDDPTDPNDDDTTLVKRDTIHYDVLKTGQDRDTICFNFNAGWHLIWKKDVYYNSICLNIQTNPKDTLVLSNDKCQGDSACIKNCKDLCYGNSACEVACDSSSTRTIIITALDSLRPQVTPLDSIKPNPFDTTIVIIPRDTTGIINPGDTTIVNPGDTTIVNPGDTTIVNPGDTTIVNPGDTTIVNPGDTTTHIIPELDSVGAIPPQYFDFLSSKVFATNNLVLRNRANLNNGVYVANSVTLDADAVANAKVVATTNVQMSNNSHIDTLVLGGTLNKADNATCNSIMYQNVSSQTLNTMYFVTGTENVTVTREMPTFRLQPGMYKNLNVYGFAKIIFEPGVYYFESVHIDTDVEMTIENENAPVQIFVQNQFNVGDRTAILNKSGVAGKFLVYSNAQNIRLGVTGEVIATLIAPNAYVEMANNAVWYGYIWAKNLILNTDASVR